MIFVLTKILLLDEIKQFFLISIVKFDESSVFFINILGAKNKLVKTLGKVHLKI